MAISIPADTITSALLEAVDALIGSMGETITYVYHDGTPSVEIRAVRQKLREEDLTGDYEQGDCRFTIKAADLSQEPAKYDEIIAADGRTYLLVDYLSCDVGINDTVLVYKPVGRA